MGKAAMYLSQFRWGSSYIYIPLPHSGIRGLSYSTYSPHSIIQVLNLTKPFPVHFARFFTMNLLYGSLWGALLFSTTAYSAATPPHSGDCKCQPHLSCWPSESEWQHLNNSVSGSLISDIRPIAAPCYKGTAEYDEKRCEEVTSMFTDSHWRADQAGELVH